MKPTNCFSLYAVIYLALAAITLPGIVSNFSTSSSNTTAAKKVEIKAKADSKNQEDVKSELLFRF